MQHLRENMLGRNWLSASFALIRVRSVDRLKYIGISPAAIE
jgi:hypothetical protein